MVIREKALARLMKDAYKGGGYTVAVRKNGKTAIITSSWAVEVDNACLPREAISMMALHMGFLPEPGDAFTIYKGSKEPEVQTKGECEAEQAQIRKTVLTYNGYNVWQQRNGAILLIDPDREQLLYKKDNVLSVGTAFFACDAESRVYIIRQEEPQISVLKHLALVTWPTVQ